MILKTSILVALSCTLLISSITCIQIRRLEGEPIQMGSAPGAHNKWQSVKTKKWEHPTKSFKNFNSGKWDRDSSSKYTHKKESYSKKHKQINTGYFPDAGHVPANLLTPIIGKWPRAGKKEETVFVNIDAQTFYQYTVTNKDCKIQLSITDQNSKCWEFEFKRFNEIVLIDAYNHIILVQQISSTGAIISLHVIQINYDSKKCIFSIDSFAVNSIQDDELFFFADPWWVTEIIEYNPIENWITIPKITKNDINIYKINIDQKMNVLLTVSWFAFLKKEELDGGNTKVLYDRRNDELMIDQNTCRYGFNDPTIFKRVPICDLVKLPLYHGQGATVNFVSWFFQYLSLSKNNKELTTFLYHGYGDRKIINPVNLKSKSSIIVKYDDFSFFTAITDCDIYLTTIEYDEKKGKYQVYSNLLSETCFDGKKRAEVVEDWSSAVEIFFFEGRFYLFTKRSFIVYSDCPTQWNKVYEDDCRNIDLRDRKVLFKYIRNFLRRK